MAVPFRSILLIFGNSKHLSTYMLDFIQDSSFGLSPQKHFPLNLLKYKLHLIDNKQHINFLL